MLQLGNQNIYASSLCKSNWLIHLPLLGHSNGRMLKIAWIGYLISLPHIPRGVIFEYTCKQLQPKKLTASKTPSLLNRSLEFICNKRSNLLEHPVFLCCFNPTKKKFEERKNDSCQDPHSLEALRASSAKA